MTRSGSEEWDINPKYYAQWEWNYYKKVHLMRMCYNKLEGEENARVAQRNVKLSSSHDKRPNKRLIAR